MFVIKLTYKASIAKIDELRPDHLKFLDQYYENGLFLASGRQEPLVGGIIIALGDDKTKIEDVIKQDPFYQYDVADFEIIQFHANKFHPKLKDLLAK